MSIYRALFNDETLLILVLKWHSAATYARQKSVGDARLAFKNEGDSKEGWSRLSQLDKSTWGANAPTCNMRSQAQSQRPAPVENGFKASAFGLEGALGLEHAWGSAFGAQSLKLAGLVRCCFGHGRWPKSRQHGSDLAVEVSISSCIQ